MVMGTAAFLLAGILLVASAAGMNLILSNLTDSRNLVLHTTAILRGIAELHVDVRAAETGQRGYILTGERRYLAPYERATHRIWHGLEALERSVMVPEMRKRLEQLRPLVGDKLEELARTVALRDHDFEAALAVVRTDAGQTIMEDIDALVAEFVEAEQDLLNQRTHVLERQAAWAARIAALTAILSLLSTVLGVLWVTRQRAIASMLEAERRFRNDLERQVEARTEQLSEVNRELDAFAYTISHDLRAPLRAIHGYADALLEDHGAALPKEGHRFASRIMSAADRMESLIRDILAYSRLAREDVSLRPMSLEAAVDKVLADMSPLINDTDARIDIQRPMHWVKAHPPTLLQLVENLVSNAVKFVPTGRRPHVVLSSEARDDRVRLWVEDNGIGIEQPHRERVFQPFQRLHGVETYPGTGIGLAIVSRSVERMGGQCGMMPGEGGGSRFWADLEAANREETPQ